MALFKQVTCDTCFRPLNNIGRHNRYYFNRIVEFERVDKSYFIRNVSRYADRSAPRFVFDVSNCQGAHSYVYCYMFDSWLSPHTESTWFCDNACALQTAIQMNSVLYYFDERENSVALITPQLREINNERGRGPYAPILMRDFPADRWLQQPSHFMDLSRYGNDTNFPTMSFLRANLIQPNRQMIPDFRTMFTMPSFARSYFGSSSPTAIEAIRNMIPDDYDRSAYIDFGRRVEFAWFITDKYGHFIGFIHITQKSPQRPFGWWLEFGLIPSQHGKGIMSEVVPKVIRWARSEGCDEPIYAISEDSNYASHAILRKIPKTQESYQQMMDGYAGIRNMRRFVMMP